MDPAQFDEYVPLAEAQVDAKAGIINLTVIQPGFNSSRSRFYTADALAKAAESQLFVGSKMYLNHPSVREETDHPIGDIRNWVAVLDKTSLSEDGRLVGSARIIDPNFREKLELLESQQALDQLGVSIRAVGKGRRAEIEGHKTWEVTEFVRRLSVDFVTEAGAGGEVHSIESDLLEMLTIEALREKRPDLVELIVHEEGGNPVDEKELREQLEATQHANVAMKTARDEAIIRADEAEAKLAEAEKAQRIAATKMELEEALAQVDLPEAVVTRLRERFQGAETTEGMVVAIQAERDYLRKLNEAGVVRDFGEGEGDPTDKTEDRLSRSIAGAFGLSEAAAKTAVMGRF